MAVNIELLRNALGLNKGEFCQEIGMSIYGYKNYANGKRVFPIKKAIELAYKYGFSLDWFYLDDGDVSSDRLKSVIKLRKIANGGE